MPLPSCNPRATAYARDSSNTADSNMLTEFSLHTETTSRTIARISHHVSPCETRRSQNAGEVDVIHASAPPMPSLCLCRRRPAGTGTGTRAQRCDALRRGQIGDEAQRVACQDSAYVKYKSCREGCEQRGSDSCDEKYQDCQNSGPLFCLRKEGGKSLCQRCWERCKAGDSPSARCRACKF